MKVLETRTLRGRSQDVPSGAGRVALGFGAAVLGCFLGIALAEPDAGTQPAVMSVEPAETPDGGIVEEATPGEPGQDAGVVPEEEPGTPDAGQGADQPAAGDTAPVGPSRFWIHQSEEVPLVRQPVAAAVWVEPLGSIFLGALGFLYLSAGANIALTSNADLVVEGAFTHGWNLFACSTSADGGWAALGVAIRFGDPAGYQGFFLQPKLRARFFSTWGGTVSTAVGTVCTADNVHLLQGKDGEVGLGLDFGYQFKWGPVFLAPQIGVNAGACFSSPGGSFFHTDLDLFNQVKSREKVSMCGGLNLNLLRLGIAF